MSEGSDDDTSEQHTSPPGPRRRRTRVALVATGIVLLAAGIVALLIPAPVPAKAITAKDLKGSTVAMDPGATPAPQSEAHAVADTGQRLVVPSVHLDVPLGALNAVDGQITPPTFTSAYRVRNLGVTVANGRHGTVYVVMHAVRGGVGPGNLITDIPAGRSALAPGAVVRVAGVAYRVSGSEIEPKSSLGHDATLWADVPNRLVLITCLEHADASPSTENLIIAATRE